MDQTMLPGMDDTLPLFSGTPVRAQPTDPAPGVERPAAGQATFAECRLCKDTGRLKSGDRTHYCWCAAGVAARREDRERGASIREITTTAIQEAFAGIVSTRPNWVKEGDEWLSWEKTLALGRDDRVASDVPMRAGS